MANELATVEDSTLELLPPARPASLEARQMLLAHAEMTQTAYELASKMCNTNLVPTRLRGKAEDGTAAILYGAELGLTPIQSLQRVVPVHGMPTLEARTMVALLRARGYRIKTLSQSDESVTVWGRDLDGEEYESTWTIDRAIKAGYVPTIDEKSGKYRLNANGKLIGNEKYLTDPQAMLKAKGQAEVCRDMAPDILIGISYTSEELESERWDDRPMPATTPVQHNAPITVEEIFGDSTDTADTQDAEPAPEPKVEPIPEREAAVATAQATLDEVATEQDDPADESDPAEPASTDDGQITSAQLRKLSLLRKNGGYADTPEDRVDWFQWIQTNIARIVSSNKELTKAEASVLIDVLESAQAQDGNR